MASLDNKQFTNSETLLFERFNKLFSALIAIYQFFEIGDGNSFSGGYKSASSSVDLKLAGVVEKIMLNTLSYKFVTFVRGLNFKMSRKCDPKVQFKSYQLLPFR